MKKCIMPILLLMSVAAVAQTEGEERTCRWSVTPHIGTNLWTARYYTSTDKPMDRRLGLTAGAEVGYEVVPRVSVSLGADYVLQRFCNDATSSYKNIHTFTGEEKCSVTVATGRIYFPLTIGIKIWTVFRCIQVSSQVSHCILLTSQRWQYLLVASLFTEKR